MIKNKKGIALNQAFGAVLTLVLVAVLVIIGIILFVNLGASFVNLDTIGITNESLAAVTNDPQFVSQSPSSNNTLCNYDAFGVGTVINETNALIAPGNYTVGSTGTIAFTGGDTQYNNTGWNVSYTASWGGASCTASNAMITQFATYPTLIGLVGTVIFLGLVIGVLVASFVFGGRGSV